MRLIILAKLQLKDVELLCIASLHKISDTYIECHLPLNHF